MDVYSETIVKRKFTPKDKAKIKTLFAALLFSSLFFVLIVPAIILRSGLAYLTTVSLIIGAIIIIGIWLTLKKMLLEFEYIITNDTLDIDKIIDKKKRQREISLEIKLVEEIGIFNEKAFENRVFEKVVRAEKKLDGEGNFYMTLYHPQHQKCLVVFTPDDKMLEALSKTLPPRIARTIPKI